MRPNVKYRVIHRFKGKYNVRDMCVFFGVSRSGYYAWINLVAYKVGMKNNNSLVYETIKAAEPQALPLLHYVISCHNFSNNGMIL